MCKSSFVNSAVVVAVLIAGFSTGCGLAGLVVGTVVGVRSVLVAAAN